jgi:hypothetical protein
MGRVYEQMPHPKIAYAYLAIEAETWNEFEKLRSEALKRHPLYGESAFEKAAPAEVTRTTRGTGAQVEVQDAAAGAEVAAEPEAGPRDDVVQAEQASAPAPTSEGLSPRDKAKAALAAKKGA